MCDEAAGVQQIAPANAGRAFPSQPEAIGPAWLHSALSFEAFSMNCAPLAISLVLLLCGCTTPRSPDVIARVVADLDRIHADAVANGHNDREFPFCLNVGILLPSNAPPREVASEALRQEDWLGYLRREDWLGYTSTNFTVLRVRKVRIWLPQDLEKVVDPVFIAVLANTPLGQRVVLMQFQAAPYFSQVAGFWVCGTFDPKMLLNKPPGANSRHGSRGRSNGFGMAAVAQAERSA
ncbi:MAG: hypothetical protein NT154_39630 [Verrucomicrobia bacterium]|nr:hypothetical protein [Verrucomicrobiota bacterium]